MSEFIEISNNVMVNKSQIAWIAKSTDEIGCVIHCGGVDYPSDLPYETMTMLLQHDTEGKYDTTMKNLDTYLKQAQIWAG